MQLIKLFEHVIVINVETSYKVVVHVFSLWANRDLLDSELHLSKHDLKKQSQSLAYKLSSLAGNQLGSKWLTAPNEKYSGTVLCDLCSFVLF